MHEPIVDIPLVLIPVVAVMTWLELEIHERGFGLASRLLTIIAAVLILVAVGTGLTAKALIHGDATLQELVWKHQTNGFTLGAVSIIAAALAGIDWRGTRGRRMFWARAGTMTFLAIGVFFSGYLGAQIADMHGEAAAVHSNP